MRTMRAMQYSGLTSDSNYERSNAEGLPVVTFPKKLRDQYRQYREMDSLNVCMLQTLADGVCEAFGIKTVAVMYEGVEPHTRKTGASGRSRISSKTHGSYRTDGSHIRLYKYTAAHKKVKATKSVVDTLLHELVHHIDTYKLGLRSIHTSGFYRRIGALKEQLSVSGR